jgi:hypothetical protein
LVMPQLPRRMVLAFDPGATTGIALVDQKDGAVLRTEAYPPSEALEYARRMEVKQRGFKGCNFDVVIEKGPEWQQHSPITRSVETKLRSIFPKAHLVTPNRWKGHPAAKCPERLDTKHEKDAVKLARWYIKSYKRDNAQNQNEVESESYTP